MDKRQETRREASLIIRIWGMDSDGRAFFQNVKADNVTTEGASLSGIAHPLKMGDVIGVQYGDRKARFKIMWLVDRGTVRKIEAGIQVMDGQSAPWTDEAKAPDAKESSGKNRRRYPRHKVHFPVDIGFEDKNRTHLQTNATDIGGRGCYIETLLPLSLGTAVNLTFWLDSEKIQSSAVVRTSDPGVGMGLEFIDLGDRIQKKLQSYLESVDRGLMPLKQTARGASVTE
ncbi:MAG TPA: PilZ domain-containing protein [Terriglobales bacterium]